MILRLIAYSIVMMLGFSTFAQQFTAYLPKSGTVTDNTTPHFFWNEVDGATSYQLQIATNSSFTQNLLTFTTSNLDFQLTAPLSFDDYFWRVEATTPSGNELTHIYELTIFSPAQISDLSLWLRPDLGVVLDGNNKVETWNDQSNNGFPLTQASSSKRPEVNPNGFNGLPAMMFSGSQVLEGGNILNLGTISRSMFVVGNHTVSSTGNFFAKALFGAANSRYSLNVRNNNDSRSFYVDNTERTNPLIITGSTSSEALYQFLVDRQNSIVLSGWNGLSNTTNIASGFNMNSNFRFLVGAFNGTGDNGETNFLNGEISEIIFFDNVNPLEQELVRGYLKSRYVPTLDLGPDITKSDFCPETLSAGTGFTSYLWSNGSTDDFIEVNATGYYTVEVTDQFGFTSMDSVYVKFPDGVPAPAGVSCNNSPLTWNPGLDPTFTYEWSNGSTDPTLTFQNSGNYYYSVTDLNGCTLSSDTVFYDFLELEASLGPDTSLCLGNEIGLVAGSQAATSFLWNTGATTPTIPFTAAGTFSVQVTSDLGCTANPSVTIGFLGQAAQVVPDIASSVCPNQPLSFNDQSFTTDGSNIIEWNWEFSDQTSYNTSSGSHTFQNPGTYTFELFVLSDNGCGNSIMDTITVFNNPSVAIAASNFCQGNNVNFNANQNTPLPINNWFWDFGNPASGSNTAAGANTQHVYGDYGPFEVTLVGTDINGCKDTATQVVNILPAPQVAFDFTEICAGDIVQFQNQTTIGGTASVTSYLWNFGDGTTTGQVNPAKPYLNPGNFQVSLNAVANNGCAGSTSSPLKVHAFPVPSIQIDPLCAGVPGSMSDQSFVPNGSVATAEWSFSDGQELSGLNIAPVFQNPGNYNVTVTVGSAFGCESSITESFSVSDFITASFTTDPLALLAEFPTTFNSTSSGAVNYFWTINDTITSEDPAVVVTFDSTQIGEMITITLTTENELGCTATTTQEMEVLRRSTDLALNEVFAQDSLGFFIVGVEMENKGTSPITQIDFFLRTANGAIIKEAWHGVLQAGVKKNFVFSTSPSTVIDANKKGEFFICIEGQIISSEGFEDEDLSNNRVCKNVSAQPEPVILMPYPNPVSEGFTLRIVMPKEEAVTVQVFNNLGQMQTQILNNDTLPAGLTELQVNTAQWSSGSYYIHLISPTTTKSAKLMVGR
jgi:PKD repeat protein